MSDHQPDTTNVVAMPPRNSKQELVAQLREWISEAERGEIVSLACAIVRPADDPADPPMSFYRWRRTWVLSAAAAWLAKRTLEDGD